MLALLQVRAVDAEILRSEGGWFVVWGAVNVDLKGALGKNSTLCTQVKVADEQCAYVTWTSDNQTMRKHSTRRSPSSESTYVVYCCTARCVAV